MIHAQASHTSTERQAQPKHWEGTNCQSQRDTNVTPSHSRSNQRASKNKVPSEDPQTPLHVTEGALPLAPAEAASQSTQNPAKIPLVKEGIMLCSNSKITNSSNKLSSCNSPNLSECSANQSVADLLLDNQKTNDTKHRAVTK